MKLADPLRIALKLPCASKKRYDTYAEAVNAAKGRTQPGVHERAKFLQPYPCEHGCGGFHLTSKPYRDRVESFPVIGAWPT